MEEGKTEPSKLSLLLLLPGSFLLAAMSIILFISVIQNAPALFEAEMLSLEVIMPVISGVTIPTAAFAIAWIPIVICILAFAIVIGGVMIVIWTKIVQKTLAEINRLAALCPTLSWFKRSLCWAALAGLIITVTAACGLFFTAAAVVSINILVVALSFL